MNNQGKRYYDNIYEYRIMYLGGSETEANYIYQLRLKDSFLNFLGLNPWITIGTQEWKYEDLRKYLQNIEDASIRTSERTLRFKKQAKEFEKRIIREV